MNLDEKDKELLQYLADGDSQKEAAAKLKVKEKFVENRLRSLRKKLTCRSTAHLLLTLKSMAAI